MFAEDSRLSPPSSPTHRTDPAKPRSGGSSSGQQPVRRFISSILGGDIPYGSRGHVLTQAQRKEYPSATLTPPALQREQPTQQKQPIIVDTEKKLLPTAKPLVLTSSEPPSSESRPSPPPPPGSVVRCSVIQRTPASKSPELNKDKEIDVTVPVIVHSDCNQHEEPEQEQPIDYHIPKRRGEISEEQERRHREVRRSSALLGRPVLSIWAAPRGGSIVNNVSGIVSAAAGHGRSAGGNSQGANQGGGNNCGNSINFNSNGGSGGTGSGTAGSGQSGMGGGAGSGSGAGGGMGGRDGRSNYGPNSPPTGSLPPFYESLKSGQGGMNAYNAANGNFIVQNAYHTMMATNLNMDCDAAQEMINLQSYQQQDSQTTSQLNNNNNSSTTKHYSMLQNAAYGIVLKDEQDLEYDSKMDALNLNSNLLQSSYGNYDVNDSMIDIGNSISDPLQFNATLTFSSTAEHDLLDSLSDAVDLSSYLQRLPSDDQTSSGNDLELSSTPSLTPDSVSITPVDNSCLDSFSDHLIMARNNAYDRNGSVYPIGLPISSKLYKQDSPPSYHQTRDMHQLLQQQHQHQQQHQQMQSHHQQHDNSNHHQQQQQQQLHHQQQLIINTGLQYDMDSHSNMSLPSPSSGSMDAPPDAKPIIHSVSFVKEEIVTTTTRTDCVIIGNYNSGIDVTAHITPAWRQRVREVYDYTCFVYCIVS